ncbi:MAG: cardiolipin synthase [Robiginitalea sp.]|nr:cardiolipin synthase [Robiginitalea sp.]
MVEALFNDMSLGVSLVLLLVYLLVLGYTVYRIIMNTQSAAKTMAYLLLIIILPLLGIVIYYSFGMDTRHGKSNKMLESEYRKVSKEFQEFLGDPSESLLMEHREILGDFTELFRFLRHLGHEKLTANSFHLLNNGEEKFPEVLKTLEQAAEYIHIEYYTWENDKSGNDLKEVLLKKAKEGVTVRVIYDAFGSRGIRKNIVRELAAGGVQIHPIIEIKLNRLANRLNHRDHRKIIIVDGHTGFVGGINVSDRYDNSIDTGLFWRDTHIKMSGPGVMNLQRHFLVNWNFCQEEKLDLDDFKEPAFPPSDPSAFRGLSQILAGGPIYSQPNIMLGYTRLFTLAREKLYITNPYFIPNETILDALKQAALSGVDVRLLLPKESDSALVGAAASFYFKALLRCGVKIYLYDKGFVHAKTAVADGRVSVVGTANMDIRSFDLNFEIMSVIYGDKFGAEMERLFLEDLEDSEHITLDKWNEQSSLKFLTYAIARLVSSLL